jgi:hypothetical protein
MASIGEVLEEDPPRRLRAYQWAKRKFDRWE